MLIELSATSDHPVGANIAADDSTSRGTSVLLEGTFTHLFGSVLSGLASSTADFILKQGHTEFTRAVSYLENQMRAETARLDGELTATKSELKVAQSKLDTSVSEAARVRKTTTNVKDINAKLEQVNAELRIEYMEEQKKTALLLAEKAAMAEEKMRTVGKTKDLEAKIRKLQVELAQYST